MSLRSEMNELFLHVYTIVSVEINVVVSTSVMRRFVGGLLPWVAGVAWQFLFSLICSRMTVFRLIRGFCFKVVHFCVVKRVFWLRARSLQRKKKLSLLEVWKLLQDHSPGKDDIRCQWHQKLVGVNSSPTGARCN